MFQIKELEEKLSYMNDVRDRMKKYVKEYKKYHDYLDRVIVETGEFHSIFEIFNRYETLIEARTILSEHQDKNLEILEERGTEMVIFLRYILLVFHLYLYNGKDAYLFFFIASYDRGKVTKNYGVE